MLRLTLVSCCIPLSLSTFAAADEPAKESVPEVTVCHPVAREVTDYAEFPGKVGPVEAVVIRPRATGYLAEVDFKGGEKIEKGQMLFRIDARRQQATCDERIADLNVAQANLKLAQTTVERDKKLLPTAAISDAQFDGDQAAANTAEALVQVARARLDSARLESEDTHVIAPISGRIGMPALSVGNLVTADSTALATIMSTDSMYVFIDIDEHTALALGRGKLAGQPLACALVDETEFPREARIDAVDNHVDASTGTLRVRAVLNNSDGRILPGMSVHTRLKLGQPYKALFVPPREAIAAEPARTSGPIQYGWVHVVTPSKTVEHRRVTLILHEGQSLVKTGLSTDDLVILYSDFGVPYRFHPGAKVQPKLRAIEAPREK